MRRLARRRDRCPTARRSEDGAFMLYEECWRAMEIVIGTASRCTHWHGRDKRTGIVRCTMSLSATMMPLPQPA